jgi:hypothetical protein
MYNCGWLDDLSFPEWMKPEHSHVIATKRSYPGRDDLTHYEFVEAGQPMTAEVLNWAINWAISNNINIVYWIGKKSHRLGTTDFTQAVFPERTGQDSVE